MIQSQDTSDIRLLDPWAPQSGHGAWSYGSGTMTFALSLVDWKDRPIHGQPGPIVPGTGVSYWAVELADPPRERASSVLYSAAENGM
jgi:hypothetical protein